MKGLPSRNRVALQHRSTSSMKSLSPSSSSTSEASSCWTSPMSSKDSLVRASMLRSTIDLSFFHHGSRATSSSSSWNEGTMVSNTRLTRPPSHASVSEVPSTGSAKSANIDQGRMETKPVLLPDMLLCLVILGVTNYIDDTLRTWVRCLDKLPLFLLVLPSTLWWPNSVSYLFLGEKVLGMKSSFALTSLQRRHDDETSTSMAVNRNMNEAADKAVHHQEDDEEDFYDEIFSPAEVKTTDDTDSSHEWGHFAYFTDEIPDCGGCGSFLHGVAGTFMGPSRQALVPLHEMDEDEE